MKNVYLAAAIIGALVPYWFFGQQFAQEGPALVPFLSAAFATPVASGFAADLFISSFVFWAFMFSAGENAPSPWPFIAMNLLIGLSCALPAWLYWRARSRGAAG